MNKEIKRILIINQPLGNRGDESAHRALMRALNKNLPDTKIKVLVLFDYRNSSSAIEEQHPNNEYVHVSHPHNCRMVALMKLLMTLRMVRLGSYMYPFLRKLIPYYKWADLVVCAPGGICMGGFQDWLHLYQLYLAKVLNKQLVYYSRSFGPFPTCTFSNRLFKRFSLEMLRYFSFLSIRDAKTMQLADELGLSYVPSIDTAFLDAPQIPIPSEVSAKLQGDYMVFVPNSLTWHYAYKSIPQERIDAFYLAIMDRLHERYPSWQIVMLPQLYGCGVQGDYTYFQKLREQFQYKKSVIVLPDVYGSDVQQGIIRGAKLVIGARYHSIVFAINQGVPFVALCYEHKMKGLLEELSLQKYGVDIDDAFSTEALARQSVVDVCALFNAGNEKAIENARKQAKNMTEYCFVDFQTKFL